MKHFSTKRMASLLLLSLVAVSAVFAAPRTVEQARLAAQQQIGKHMAKRVSGQGGVTAVNPQLVFSKTKQGAKADDAYYYVFSAGKNLGYTIVSGDDRFPAIVGYTEEGDYDTNNLPTNLVSFMQAYQDFVDNATEAQIAEINAWKAQAVHAFVAPLMQEKWNQGDPYNRMCPEYKYYNSNGGVSTDKAVTGCVATAIAQILHYHKCPNELKADIPAYNFTYTVNGYKNEYNMPAISANGESYDWGNMLNVYTGNETDVQKDAVAKLMKHIGYAVRMSYGPSSGASASAETFTKYFGMDKEQVKQLSRSSYQISEWDKILYEEMAAGRPVYYDGQSTGGGHAFVIHGYDAGLYYVNWGWGGYCDGYFDITILNPQSTSGAGASSSDDGYSMDNGMIIGIQPDNGVVDEVIGATMASNGNLSGTFSVNGNVLSGTVIVSPKNQCLQGKTNVGIGYIDNNGDIVKVSNSSFEINSEQLPVNYFYRDVNFACSFQYEENKTYKLILIESRDMVNWIACLGAENTALAIKVEKGEVKEVTPQSTLSAEATLDENSGGYTGMSNTINVTVTNTGDKEYYDQVSVYVSNTDTKPSEYTFAQGITAPVDGSTTFNFAYTPKTAGTYYFWILDVGLNEIGKSSITFNTTTAPVLSFVSITCDNASNDDAKIDFYDSKIAVKKVYDDKAEFTFAIKNDGGYYEGPFWIWYYNPSTYGFGGSQQKLVLPANETTKFNFKIEGNVGDVVGLMIRSANQNVTIAGLQNTNKHYIYDENGKLTGGYYYFGDAEICYLAGYKDEIKITGKITQEDIEEIEKKEDLTTLDLTEATNIPESINLQNPNTLIYVSGDVKINNGKNVIVKVSDTEYTCSNLDLTDGEPFNAKYDFTATNASYTRNVSNVTRAANKGWYSICLPYNADIPKNITVEEFKYINTEAKTITFGPVRTTMKANKPYIFEAAGEVTFNASSVTVVSTPEEIKDDCFIGTYTGIEAPNLNGFYVLKSDGTGFAVANEYASADPFRAVIDTQGQANAAILKVIHGGGDGTTGITEVGTDADNTNDYYNLNGVKVTTPQKGIYIKNGKKYIFK